MVRPFDGEMVMAVGRSAHLRGVDVVSAAEHQQSERGAEPAARGGGIAVRNGATSDAHTHHGVVKGIVTGVHLGCKGRCEGTCAGRCDVGVIGCERMCEWRCEWPCASHPMRVSARFRLAVCDTIQSRAMQHNAPCDALQCTTHYTVRTRRGGP